MVPQQWEPAKTLVTIEPLVPQLASWDGKAHPSQMKLQHYLREVQAACCPLPESPVPLCLDLAVDIGAPDGLLKQRDLENYLTPLLSRQGLGSARFCLVMARKRAGGGSRLTIGTVVPRAPTAPHDRPPQLIYHLATAHAGWKDALHAQLAGVSPQPIAATPTSITVEAAIACGPRRNWVNLWKPLLHCMGPVLGAPNPARRYAPNDDWITALTLHRSVVPDAGHAAAVSLRWTVGNS